MQETKKQIAQSETERGPKLGGLQEVESRREKLLVAPVALPHSPH